MLNAGAPRVAIGLHLTLTAPFRPLSAGFTPLHDGAVPAAHGNTRRVPCCAASSTTRSRPRSRRQLGCFRNAFGRAPDFIDGHQHVHLFPQIATRVLEVAKESAPDAWVRQCGRVGAARGAAWPTARAFCSTS